MPQEEKTYEDMLVWIDQNKAANNSENATWREKSKDIGERKDT